MEIMRFTIRWGWLLGLALFAPAALPAGGADRMQPEIRRRQGPSPLLTLNDSLLKTSPFAIAPSLRKLQAGTPVRVLHQWQAPHGSEWLYVCLAESDLLGNVHSASRGWVSV